MSGKYKTIPSWFSSFLLGLCFSFAGSSSSSYPPTICEHSKNQSWTVLFTLLFSMKRENLYQYCARHREGEKIWFCRFIIAKHFLNDSFYSLNNLWTRQEWLLWVPLLPMRKQDLETCIRSHDYPPLDLELELGFLTPGPVFFPLYYTVSFKLSVIFSVIIKFTYLHKPYHH